MTLQVVTYEQQVEAAAAALKVGDEANYDANWELARLTYENTLNHGERNPAKVTMPQWCADVVAASGRRFGRRTGQVYKAVWAKFVGRDSGDQITWSEAYWSIRGTTPDESFGHVRARLAKASPEVKREAFKALAADDVIDTVDRAVFNSLEKFEAAQREHLGAYAEVLKALTAIRQQQRQVSENVTGIARGDRR